jgi:4'-phosphopantetheinyl transferase
MVHDLGQCWNLPRVPLILPDSHVHIWRASLDVAPALLETLCGTLAADERARAARFRFARDRARFIAGRGVLRAILARYLERAPGAITFRYGPSGKPALHDENGSDDLRFNVSHAGGVALYAMTRGREIGVDIEATRTEIETERIAARFFSPREIATLRSLPPEQRHDAFFRCWTRKEAYVKARGAGITTALDAFDVSLAPDEPAAILAIREAGAAGHWSLHHLVPGPGAVGAVAVAGERVQVACWQWQEPRDLPGGQFGRRCMRPQETVRD